MLSALEDRLLAALCGVYPADVALAAGPAIPPRPDVAQLLAVTAVSLNRSAGKPGEEDSRREPAFFQHRFPLAADRQRKDFTLPADATGGPVTVESPPGTLARAGDDYFLDERILHFYRAPPQDIVISLQGERARGYREFTAGWIELELNAWADTPPQVDALLTPALAVVLALLADLDVLELVRDEPAGLQLRLLKPVAGLSAIVRSTEVIAQARYVRGTARLQLRGELELTLTLGVPSPQGRIEKVIL